MIKSRIQIYRLTFLGPNVDPCRVDFGPTLNVIYGPTETGKSFIIDAIDFMFGGKELREIPERMKYDSIVLWIDVSDDRKVTLQRSTEGKGFLWADGHLDRLTQETATSLSQIHSSRADSNLSIRLLTLLGLRARPNLQWT